MKGFLSILSSVWILVGGFVIVELE